MSSPPKRKASVEAEEAQKRTKTDDTGAVTKLSTEESGGEVNNQDNSDSVNDSRRKARRAISLIRRDANAPDDSYDEKQAIRSQQRKHEVWSRPVLDRIAEATVDGETEWGQIQEELDALWLGSGAKAVENAGRILDLVLDISVPLTDEDLEYKLPHSPVVMEGQDGNLIRKIYEIQKTKIEKRHNHDIMIRHERVKIAAAVMRLFKHLHENISDVAREQSHKSQRLETQVEAIIAEIATLRKEVTTLHIENAGFKKDILLLQAAI